MNLQPSEQFTDLGARTFPNEFGQTSLANCAAMLAAVLPFLHQCLILWSLLPTQLLPSQAQTPRLVDHLVVSCSC